MKRGAVKSHRKSSIKRKAKKSKVKSPVKRKRTHTKHEPARKKDHGSVIILSAALILLISMIVFIAPLTNRSVDRKVVGETAKLPIVVFVDPLDSQSMHLENLLVELSQRFRGRIDLSLVYSLRSEESESEAKYQICASELLGDSFMHYLYCFNDRYPESETCRQQYIVRDISACVTGEAVDEMLRTDREMTVLEGVVNLPTILIAGFRYNGDRSETGLSREICERLNDAPPICSVIPQCITERDCAPRKGLLATCVERMCIYDDLDPVPVTVITCPDCDTKRALGILEGTLGNIVVTEIDASKASLLINEHGIVKLPAYIISGSVVSNPGINRLDGALVQSGNDYLLSDEASGSEIDYP